MRDLKLTSTTLAADVALRSLAVCGLGGYRRDSKFSVDRNVRDVLGGQLMAHNDRFYADNAQLLIGLKEL
jgi:acyl-CoA dehydrogenase